MSNVTAVIVDYYAGDDLRNCVASLKENGVSDIVIVENGALGSTPRDLADNGVRIVSPGVNLGYGRGVNRGVAAAGDAEQILVTNPDVTFHAGAVAALSTYLATHETTAIVGPRIERPDGTSYPSQRIFPNMWLAGAHALLAPLWPANPATKRYRATHRDGSVDWVSGAAFLIRRDAFDAVGGFDERYFMFAEDMKLCWDLRQQGWLVAGDNDAVITHVEGVSRARVSRKMAVAHTTSALRFEWHTARGLRRWFVPLAAIVLLLRLGVVLVVPSRKG